MYSSILKKKGLVVIIIFLTVLHCDSIPAGALGGRRRVRAGERACLSSGIETADTQPTRGESVRDNLLDSLKVADKGNGFPIAGRTGFPGKKTSGQVKEQIPDHNPAMTNDNKGNTYLIFEHGNELRWAVNKGGDWIACGKMPGTGGNRPVIVYIPGLQSISGGQETSVETSAETADQGTSTSTDQGADQRVSGYLFCAWESLTSPKKIMGSTGTLTDIGVTWSEPQSLTADEHDDYGLALVTDSNHQPVILWLQRASLDDDADLYYQVITAAASPASSSSGSSSDSFVSVNQVMSSVNQVTPSASTSGNQVAISVPTSSDQVTASSPVVEDRGASQAPSDGDPATPSNWAAQAVPPPIAITGPIQPYITSGCLATTLARISFGLPSYIPMLGDSLDLVVAHLRCYHPISLSPVGTPAVIDELVTELTLGPHVTVGFNLFAVGQAAFNTSNSTAADANSPLVEETIFEYGGSTPFLYLSFPIPLRACGRDIGSTRIGAAGAVGLSFAYIRRPGDTELPREFETELNMAMGPQQTVSSFGKKFQGFINVGAGYALIYAVPQSPSRPSFAKSPYFYIAGAARLGGDWAALIYRYAKVYTPENLGKWRDPNAVPYRRTGPWIDPDYFQEEGDPNYSQEKGDPNSPQEEGDPDSPQKSLTMLSMKDKITKTMTSIMNDGKTLLDEMLEMGKAPLTGTGAVYEGKTVIGDISGDLYNDGIPAVARSESGEIMVVWAKAFAASALGTKIYAATYTGEGWGSPVEVTPEIAFHEGPAIVFDSGGKLMAVWSSASNVGLDYEQSSVEQILMAIDRADLMYSQRIEGTWTAPKLLAKLSGLDEQVDLAAGPNGEIMAVWINQSDKGSLLYSSLWNGSRWSEPALIAKTVLAESPAVIYTAQKPSVLWAQDKDGQTDTFEDWELYSSSWDGTSWSSQPLSISKKLTNKNLTNENLANENLAGEKKDNQSKFRGLKENIPAIRSGRHGRRRVNSQ